MFLEFIVKLHYVLHKDKCLLLNSGSGDLIMRLWLIQEEIQDATDDENGEENPNNLYEHPDAIMIDSVY